MSKTFLFNAKHSVARKIGTVARISGGKNAIEHIDTVRNSLKNVFGGSYSHNIFRLFFRQKRKRKLRKARKCFRRLTYTQSADCNSRQIKRRNEFRTLNAQIFKKIPLYNRKKNSLVSLTSL